MNNKIVHGKSHERIYSVWHHMIERCENKNSNRYSAYGGRGISVCKEWHSAKSFIDWATNNGYSDNLQRMLRLHRPAREKKELPRRKRLRKIQPWKSEKGEVSDGRKPQEKK